MNYAKTVALMVAFIMGASSEVAYADLGIAGDTVRVSRQIPSTAFVFGPFVYTAQVGPVDQVSLSAGDNLSLDVENTSLQFIFGPHLGSGGPYTAFQHYILFEDLTPTAPRIVGLTFQTNLQGFTDSDLAFTQHTVTIGHGGLSWTGTEYLTINLQLVPEPSSLVLFGIGATVVITLRRRTLSHS